MLSPVSRARIHSFESGLEMSVLSPELDCDLSSNLGPAQPLLSDSASGDIIPDSHQFLGYVDSAAERKLVAALDIRILPILALMYLCSALDRGNLGNAETDGLSKDLGLHGHQFSLIVTALNVPFACLTVPGVMLARRLGAHVAMPGFMLCWGTVCLLNAAVTNFSGMVAVRFLLGTFEAGFAPTLIFYLTSFYTREELAQRICAFFSMLAVAGAGSGMLSFGIFQVQRA